MNNSESVFSIGGEEGEEKGEGEVVEIHRFVASLLFCCNLSYSKFLVKKNMYSKIFLIMPP